MRLQMKPLTEPPGPGADSREGPGLGKCLLSVPPDSKPHAGKGSVLVKSVNSLQTPLTPLMSHEVEADMPQGILGRALASHRRRPWEAETRLDSSLAAARAGQRLRPPSPQVPALLPQRVSLILVSTAPRGWQVGVPDGGVWVRTPALPAILGRAAVGVGRRGAGRAGEWAAKHLS